MSSDSLCTLSLVMFSINWGFEEWAQPIRLKLGNLPHSHLIIVPVRVRVSSCFAILLLTENQRMASGFHGSSVPEGNGLAYIYRGGVCRQIEKENGEVVFSLTPSEFEAQNRKITTADELFELCNVDIPDRDPSSYGPGFPLRLKDKPNNIRTVSKYSSKAIELYNDNHGTNYKFVKLKGRNNVFVAGVVLYITFEATDKDRYGGQCKTFNAEMFHRVLSKPEIMSCDLQCT